MINSKFLIILNILLLTLSCDFIEVDRMSERDYLEEMNGDFTITLSSDKDIYHYTDEILYISATFSEKVLIDNIDKKEIICTGGIVLDKFLTEDDVAKSHTSRYYPDNYNYSCIISIKPTGEDIEIFFPYNSIENSDGLSNAYDSNKLIIRADIFDNGKIAELCWSNSNNIIYGIDNDKQKVYEIDLVAETILKESTLLKYGPIAMDFSEVEDKLFIVNENTPHIEILNMNSYETTIYQYDTFGKSKDIEVDSIHRRIYVLTEDSKLYCLNMDDGSIIFDGERLETRYFALIEENQQLFTGSLSTSPAYLSRYSVSGDVLIKEEEVNNGSNGSSDDRSIVFNPDKSIVCSPNSSSNSGYTVYAFDATDLTTHFNQWDIGYSPQMVFFNPKKDILYGTNGSSSDNYLYIMSTVDYSKIRTIKFPNCSDYVRFSTNKDGTAAVGFSYDTYHNDKYRLYFFNIE